ncbi:leucyl aminopeptidase family protein [bacterium]|nr:leucyl aminopeptidase family protein [bacterium]QQR55758.1 MAG: leucyl aminopeptidase family protein [Candidatus Melainabacteria bacterium]
MKFWVITDTTLPRINEDMVILPAFEHDFDGNRAKTESVGHFDSLASGALLKHASVRGFAGKNGQTMIHFLTSSILAAQKALLMGVGKSTEVTLQSLQTAVKEAFKQIGTDKAEQVTFDLKPLLALGLDPFAIGKMISITGHLILYTGLNYKTRNAPKNKFSKLRVLADAANAGAILQGLSEGDAIGRSVNFARDLTTMPANVLTPVALKNFAQLTEKESAGSIKGKYYDKKKLAKMKANAILAVNQGSSKAPWMSELTYTPEGGPTKDHLFIVGKSVCFDTGGLDLKPAAGMRFMKRDMAGGATALAILKAVAALKLPLSVTVILPAVENMPDGNAFRPGDYIETMSGLTVEVDNTDAEGRLTLADAITWAKKQGATHMVDFATLTGAVKSIGGDVAAGLFGNNASFTQLVAETARGQDEQVEVMTMYPELKDLNASDVADLSNSGGDLAGSTTAAWFIREFAGEETPWVHLDIASVAYRNRAIKLDPRGSTGYGVRTGIALVQAMAKMQK